MSSLTDLALKGHFEELKKKYSAPEHDLLPLIKTALSMAEDLYETNPELFKKKYRASYSTMLAVLKKHGSSYQGHPDLIEGDVSHYEKKPMQKAGRKNSKENKERRAG